MSPTEPAPERYFVVQMHAAGGWCPVLRVRADTVCNFERNPNDKPIEEMVFKRGGKEVGRVLRHLVAAWWVEETAPSDSAC